MPARELDTSRATRCGWVAVVPREAWEILTNGFQDQRVGCHSLPVQTHDCPDHPIPEANAEFAILVPTCSKQQVEEKLGIGWVGLRGTLKVILFQHLAMGRDTY